MENSPQPVKEEQTHKDKGQKREPREKRPRPERKNEYDYNPDLIDENTVIPPRPKKNEEIKKPDIKDYKARQLKNKAKIEEIIEKKKVVRAEKFKFNKIKGAGEGDTKYNEFQNEVSEVKEMRDRLGQLKKERNTLRDRLHQAIEEAKDNNEKIKEFKAALKGSRENFSARLEDLEHRLITADLNKDDEKNMNNEITILKRKIREAESSGNIELKLQKCELRKEELDDEIADIKKEKDPIEEEFKKLQSELDKKNEHIDGIKGQMAADKNERTEEKERHDKQYENWKEEKKKRLDKLEDQITKIKQGSKKIWDEFHDQQEAYWQQKQLIDFIEWQTRTKNRKLKSKEREARQAEYEKRDQEREKEEKLQRFIKQIEQINELISYLNGIKGTTEKKQVQEENKPTQIDLNTKLASDAQWKKEKGLEILTPKKSKGEEEEVEKKHKKQKKKKDNKEAKVEQKFMIPFNIQTMFEALGLLAPASVEAIDGKIKELKEREQLYLKVSREEATEDEAKLVQELKAKQGKKEKKIQVKKEVEEEFPSI